MSNKKLPIKRKIRSNIGNSEVRQIARDLGVDNSTVSAQRKEMENNSQLSKLDTSIGADGKKRRKPVSVFNPTKREERAEKNILNIFIIDNLSLSIYILAKLFYIFVQLDKASIINVNT